MDRALSCLLLLSEVIVHKQDLLDVESAVEGKDGSNGF